MGIQTQQLIHHSKAYQHYYLCHYIPFSSGHDELSKSLIHFKLGWPLDVAAWTECSIAELRRTRKPDKETLFLRAIGSSETFVDDKRNLPLDRLGWTMAREFDGFYLPACLAKNRKTEKVATLSRNARVAELSNVYSFALPDAIKSPKRIILIDDILTTGATMGSLIDAIQVVLPHANIALFTLAVTDHNSTLNASAKLQSYCYEGATESGWSMVEEDSDGYSGLNKLKSSILHNFEAC